MPLHVKGFCLIHQHYRLQWLVKSGSECDTCPLSGKLVSDSESATCKYVADNFRTDKQLAPSRERDDVTRRCADTASRSMIVSERCSFITALHIDAERLIPVPSPAPGSAARRMIKFA